MFLSVRNRLYTTTAEEESVIDSRDLDLLVSDFDDEKKRLTSDYPSANPHSFGPIGSK